MTPHTSWDVTEQLEKLAHAQEPLTRDNYKRKFLSLLDLEEETHSKILSEKYDEYNFYRIAAI